MKLKWFVFFILILSSLESWPKQNKPKTSAQKEKAIVFLKKVLSQYKNQNIHFKIEKQVFLPSIDHWIKEKGNFYLGNQKFFLQMKGEPSYFMLFDGNHLWYQPDLNEKIVFKFSEHPQLNLFFGLFDSKKFFEYFIIHDFEKRGYKYYVFHLKAQNKLKGIKEIFITVRNHIEESRVIWSDLNQRQRYKFLNPWVKKAFANSRFQFETQDVEIVSKDLF